MKLSCKLSSLLNRDSRYLMVQTEDQYIYLHFALLECIKVGDTEVKAQELRDYIARKRDIDLETGKIFAKFANFQKLRRYTYLQFRYLPESTILLIDNSLPKAKVCNVFRNT